MKRTKADSILQSIFFGNEPDLLLCHYHIFSLLEFHEKDRGYKDPQARAKYPVLCMSLLNVSIVH